MDHLLFAEFAGLVGVIIYVGYSTLKHEDRRTQMALLFHAFLLGVDVFVLRRHRPDWFRDSINTYALCAWGYCYAKVYHKYLLALLSMLGR